MTYSFARYVAGKFTGTILQSANSMQEAISILSDTYNGVFLYICTVKDILIDKERKLKMKVSIKGLSKGKVLAALYNNAITQGWGVLHFTPEDMTEQEANELLKEQSYFDYLKGRVIKIDLSEDEFDPWGYDRDNGQGKAQSIIDKLF